MLELIRSYYSIWMPLLLIACVVQALVHYYRGRRINREFSELSSGVVRFHESGASGQRKRPFILGGASRVLDVSVTDRELCIKGILPIFTAVGKSVGMTHRIALPSIKHLVRKGEKIRIDFTDENGGDCQLELLLKNPEAFVHAVSLSGMVQG